jgi:hypothetical protein
MDSIYKTIAFDIRELSETYVLKTLYNYMQEEKFTHKICFTGQLGENRTEQELNKIPKIYLKEEKTIDQYVGINSDITSDNYYPYKSLTIDASILKNCAKPLTSEEISKLKSKYNITTDKPIITTGFSWGNSQEMTIIREFYDKAQIYLVGSISKDFLKKSLPDRIVSQLRVINTRGVLKDYYAMADVALTGDNLYETTKHLHNFVEATEGGPLFIIPPTKTKQYGYKELVQTEAIREFKTIRDLVINIESYLKNPNNITHRETRAEHLNNSRKKYLPLIKKLIELEIEDKTSEIKKLAKRSKNVKIETLDYPNISIKHQDTNWE